ncbi:MAG: CotH kinase family protein [Lachnospiraceae bacterium]|nr:CotH kinase family protein [Lachnospiraceae bacterium]
MNAKRDCLIFFAVASVLVCFLTVVIYMIDRKEEKVNQISAAYYTELPKDVSEGDPLAAIGEDFVTDVSSFSGNLPLVVLRIDGDLPQYKTFKDGMEIVDTEVDPWTTGQISLYDDPSGVNALTDQPVIVSDIRIKKRGHTSISFDKPQYYIKLTMDGGLENPQDIFGMGADDSWILGGNMADKSMLRNYLAYRVSAQVMEYAPRCCFCEVFTEDGGVYTYQGVYLMEESVRRSENRVQIDETQKDKVYTSYLVRRDRFTNYDTMLDTYARLEGLSDEWIGVKYPSVANQTEDNLAYIQEDFSKIERMLLSDNPSEYKSYPRYLDTASFVDYFLINEYFGNYDAGEHSTYMYKSSWGNLKIGPVWDFDQAMNNSVVDETDPYTLAMQDKEFFENLIKDSTFVGQLKKRYSTLQTMYLNDDYIFGIIDETTEYLRSARAREWYRWAGDYLDPEERHGNYHLDDYTKEGMTISRFNDDYDQEIYNIKTYLSLHGKVIQSELTAIERGCVYTTGLKGEMTMMFLITCALFAVPSILINRK